MSFGVELEGFAKLVEQRARDVFVGSALEVQRSVVEGSEITGAPGQPIDTGNLKGSWIGAFTESLEWQTTTGVVYAEAIEHGVGMTLRSKVGGFHSVALTTAAWGRIVDVVRDRVVQ